MPSIKSKMTKPKTKSMTKPKTKTMTKPKTKSMVKPTTKPKTKSMTKRSMTKILQLGTSVQKCELKKCKKETDQRRKLQDEIYEAVGWNKKFTKIDLKKQDNKKRKKLEILQRENNKIIAKCMATNCKKQVNNYVKYAKQFQ